MSFDKENSPSSQFDRERGIDLPWSRMWRGAILLTSPSSLGFAVDLSIFVTAFFFMLLSLSLQVLFLAKKLYTF